MPPELLPASPLQWGVTGVLLLMVTAFVYALLSGRVVARQVVEDVRQDSEKRLDQAQEVITMWKDVADTRKSVVDSLLPVLTEMRKDQEIILKASLLFIQQSESGSGP